MNYSDRSNGVLSRETHLKLRGSSRDFRLEERKKLGLRAKPSGQDAPPTGLFLYGFPYNPTVVLLYKVELIRHVEKLGTFFLDFLLFRY